MSHRNHEKEHEDYIFFKTIMYLVAGFTALFIATCSGGCTVNALASGEKASYGYVVWAIVFGIVAVICLHGFGDSKEIIEKYLNLKGDEPEEP